MYICHYEFRSWNRYPSNMMACLGLLPARDENKTEIDRAEDILKWILLSSNNDQLSGLIVETQVLCRPAVLNHRIRNPRQDSHGYILLPPGNRSPAHLCRGHQIDRTKEEYCNGKGIWSTIYRRPILYLLYTLASIRETYKWSAPTATCTIDTEMAQTCCAGPILGYAIQPV